jgi:NAD(P)-dependent dehydrogenase (short-subunit alcohol dehydrogenase family)
MTQVFNKDILQGKVAFVTGGGTGITGGVARSFAEHGAKLAIASRKEENPSRLMFASTMQSNTPLIKLATNLGKSTSSSTAPRATSFARQTSCRLTALARSSILILKAPSTSVARRSRP